MAVGGFAPVTPTSWPTTKRQCGPSRCGNNNLWQVPLRPIAASLPLPPLGRWRRLTTCSLDQAPRDRELPPQPSPSPRGDRRGFSPALLAAASSEVLLLNWRQIIWQ